MPSPCIKAICSRQPAFSQHTNSPRPPAVHASISKQKADKPLLQQLHQLLYKSRGTVRRGWRFVRDWRGFGGGFGAVSRVGRSSVGSSVGLAVALVVSAVLM